MECLDHALELGDLVTVVTGRRISALRRIETDSTISPVVTKTVAGLGIDPFVLVLIELENRHQLDAIHAD